MKIFKLVSVVVAVVMILGMVACGSSSNGDSTIAKVGVIMDEIINIVQDSKDVDSAIATIDKYTKDNEARIVVLQKQMAKIYNSVKNDKVKNKAYEKKIVSISNQYTKLFKISMKWAKNTKFRNSLMKLTNMIIGKK